MIDMPDGLVRLQARLSEFLPNPPLTRDQLVMLQTGQCRGAGRPGLAELGIAPKSVEAVVPGYLTRFRPRRWPAAGGRPLIVRNRTCKRAGEPA